MSPEKHPRPHEHRRAAVGTRRAPSVRVAAPTERTPSLLGERGTAQAIRHRSNRGSPAFRTACANGAEHDSSSPQAWAWPSKNGAALPGIVPGAGDLGEKKLCRLRKKS